jgi:ATP-dependent Clp protease ATP-binding subunit ClpA
LINIEPELKKLIFGQDEAIEMLAKAIKVSRSGLCRANKPILSAFFAGPTGVGKTQLAKDLATVSGMGFRLFNMSEYSEKHEVSKLLGAAPGFVGFDSTPGQLTDFVIKHPNSVIVFDEAEKSHPDVMNIFLSIMDDANIVDNMGRKADFKGTAIIFTSNAGSREMEKRHLGFDNSVGSTDGAKTAVSNLFTPEFRNRLTATVFFNHLGTEVINSIVKKNIRELEEQLKPKKISLKLTDAALEWLARGGYSRAFGARPMARLIDTSLRTPLAELIVSNGADIYDKTVCVDVGASGLVLEVVSDVCAVV